VYGPEPGRADDARVDDHRVGGSDGRRGVAFDERRFTVLPPDPHNLDGDHNGIGCEEP
jgi:hypothetical protein